MAEALTVITEFRNGVAIVRLNRPQNGNSLNLAMCAELKSTFKDLSSNDEVGAVLFTGEGRLFCTGGDVAAMAAADDKAAFISELASAAHEAVLEIARFPKPIVSAIHGPSAGAGISFALLTDYVVAGPKATFTTAYVAIGLTPDCGQSWLLPRAIGVQRALDLTLTTRTVSRDEALELGIVAKPSDDPFATALEIAQKFASRATGALGQARKLIRQSDSTDFQAHLDLEAATITQAAASPEAAELITQALR